jgi:hypothetical protein
MKRQSERENEHKKHSTSGIFWTCELIKVLRSPQQRQQQQQAKKKETDVNLRKLKGEEVIRQHIKRQM